MSDPAIQERIAETVRLAEEGIALMRQNLRRRHGDDSEEQIDARLQEWLDDRPMDAPGRVIYGAFR